MENSESKELQSLHNFLMIFVYVLVLIDIIVFTPFFSNERLGFVIEKLSKIGIYQNVFYTKLFTMFMLIISCIGTKARKKLDLDPVKHIAMPIFIGFIVFFGSAFVMGTKGMRIQAIDYIYIGMSFVGCLLMNMGFDNISKAIKHNLMKDRFNIENESFEQSKEKVDTEFSVNIPMSYYYKKRRQKGWINLVNPFRGTLLIGTPGSGKSFSVVNTFIRQLAMKGFSLCVYDFKFPGLGKIAYYNFHKAKNAGVLPQNAEFHVINFNNVEYSRRVNPLRKEYITILADAIETAEALIHALESGKSSEGGGADKFFTQSAVNFLASIIYFFSRYKNGIYSDLPHVLAFLNKSYAEIFDVLFSNSELRSLLSPFQSAYNNKAFDQLEGQIGTLKVQISRLATKESFWVFIEDPKKKIDLKISSNTNPSYFIIANSSETQNINSALNALVLNRLVRQMNSKGNRPSSIIVDELPTLYFHKIANLLSTARSNKVAVLLGLQEIPQLRVSYSKNGADEICSVCGNVISGSARNKETLDWLEKLFGKVKQVKENLSIDRNRTTISINENMDFMIPASKIANLQTGELVGQIAFDYGMSDDENFVTTAFNCRTEFDLKAIEKEEQQYVDCPKYYKFESIESREKILMSNYDKVYAEIDDLIDEITG